MYLNILLRRFLALQMNLFYCVKLYLTSRAKSCDPQKTYSGATHYIIYVIITKCNYYYIYCTRIRNKCGNVTCVTGLTWAENRSDMDCE